MTLNTNDKAMLIAAQELDELLTEATTNQLFYTDKTWRSRVCQNVHMQEAYEAGTDMVYAKTAYQPDDYKDVGLNDLLEKLTIATVYADDWRKQRGL
jgi:hypothetical protein